MMNLSNLIVEIFACLKNDRNKYLIVEPVSYTFYLALLKVIKDLLNQL
jgi:hypothetical protein